MANWVTDSQDEQSLEELFRDVDQIHIPIFQRAYVWGRGEFGSLCNDIEKIEDSVEGSQFLGAIVSYERARPRGIVGRMKSLDIVDGQQRLLTLTLFIMAIAERFLFYEKETSIEIINEFLLLPPRRGLEINTRIVPSAADRNQFRAVWDRLNSPELLKDLLSANPPRPPLPSGESTGKILNQYSSIIQWLKRKTPKEPVDAKAYLRELLEIITQKLTFVHLKLTDASVATKIFERLNYRGVKVSVADLVRNEVFSRSDENTEESIRTYEVIWRPFEVNFEHKEEGFFFPYCLIHNSNTKKSELFSELRVIWKDFGPEQIINHMEPYQRPYLYLVTGRPNFHDRELNRAIIRLNELKTPSALYPFLIKLLYEVEQNTINIAIARSILEFIEAFLVRRAILGFEPTGLHALFKGMWNDLKANVNASTLKSEILKRPTIQYPSDEEVVRAIKSRPLAKSRVCKFLLLEYDSSIPGDTPADIPTVEHILPQSYDESSEWVKYFSKEEHKLYKDTLANVLPLSAPLNTSIKSDSYPKKRVKYLKDSMFVTARRFAEEYEVWDIESINQRSEELSHWVLGRWKG